MPVARYVQFRDQQTTQPAFVTHAEAAYDRLTRADAWTAESAIETSSDEAVAERRGLFRRQQTRPVIRTPVTPALAEAHRLSRTEPAAMQTLEGCAAGRRLASLIGEVLGELVDDLAAMPVPEQKIHAAYRQTLRLAAELTALCEVTAELGCRDPLGCVALRSPEHWGRREEDVEVAEVRAVLLELAQAANRAGGEGEVTR